MNATLMAAVCNQVYRRYPEVLGAQPKVQTRPEGNFQLVFSKMVKAADGHLIPRTVRVVVNAQGKILRMTTSK